MKTLYKNLNPKFKKASLSPRKGFTLLEILLVVAVIAILAGIVIIAINPPHQLGLSRDAERKSDLNTLYKAVNQYLIDHATPPLAVTETLTPICDSGASTAPNCSATTTDLSALVPKYLTSIPKDPLATTDAGYKIMRIGSFNVYIEAPNTEVGFKDQPGYSSTTPIIAFVGQLPQEHTPPAVTEGAGNGGGGDQGGGHTSLSYVSQIGGSGSGNDQFNNPKGIATDGTYIYIADTSNNRIVKRRANNLNYVSQIGSQGSGNDQFNNPMGIAIDGTYLYVADMNNNRIVKRLASDLSYVSKIGSPGGGNNGFFHPSGIAVSGGYLYIADLTNERLVKRQASDLSYVSQTDQFSDPYTVSSDGNYVYAYILDTSNYRIVKLQASDLSYVSQLESQGSGNDQFSYPLDIFADGSNVYVADASNNRIVKRLASDLSYVSQIGTQGSGNDQFNNPNGIVTDGTYIYVVDTGNNRIVKRYK